MYSMTGYGRSENSNKSISFIVNVKSINNRYFDLNIKLPKLLSCYEEKVTSTLKKELRRGKIDIYVSYTLLSEKYNQIDIDYVKLKQGEMLLKNISNKSDLIMKNIDFSYLFKTFDIIKSSDTQLIKTDERLLLKTIKEALDNLKKSRKREGDKILLDLNKYQKKIKKNFERINKISEVDKKKLFSLVSKKIKKIYGNKKFDKDKAYQEIGINPEKIDISEEIDRLKIHLEHLYTMMNSKTISIGKKISFLIQEISRELNTISAKANNEKISILSVDSKNELEKVREQIQNIL